MLKTHCRLDAAGQELIRHAMEELHLSARAYDRLLKVSRTIADLAEEKPSSPSMRWRLSSIARWSGICSIESSSRALEDIFQVLLAIQSEMPLDRWTGSLPYHHERLRHVVP
jgi:hypothetical protein